MLVDNGETVRISWIEYRTKTAFLIKYVYSKNYQEQTKKGSKDKLEFN